MGTWLLSETFWLDLTNIALGVVTLACVGVVGFGVVQELLPRLRNRFAGEDDHALLTPDLGLTMADGGRRVAGPGKPPRWPRRVR